MSVVLACAASSAAGTAENQQAALSAAAWLESVQNLDGSWGTDPSMQGVYTATVVDALRDAARTGPSYFRGVTWLENHAALSIDTRARRISALVAHGDDLSADRLALLAAFRSMIGIGAGWGLSEVYGPSALDTALVLIAFADLGVTSDFEVQAGLDYLKASCTQDNGWAIRGSTTADPIVTSIALRALKRYVALDSSLAAIGNSASIRLMVSVNTLSPSDQQAHAARSRAHASSRKGCAG